MIPVGEGMTVDTESEATKKAQDGVLEFLLINHPLDCPVCDKGGECPLQDQTVAFGPGESRFVEEKRHYEKPIPISDTVYLDRERCILCDRCTASADDVAGDTLIHFMDRGNSTQVNTFPDEPFASYFSGNTVQICPVGALTAKPYRFKARPWDLEETISTAWIDSVGSRVTVQSSRNQVLRLLGVDADSVNWGWLSDKERFGFEALNSEDRLTAPMVRVDGRLEATGWAPALAAATDALRDADPARIGVIGGARLTNESQYAWTKLAKGVLGTDHVDAQLGDGLPGRGGAGLPRATINQACTRAAPSSSSVPTQGRPRGAVPSPASRRRQRRHHTDRVDPDPHRSQHDRRPLVAPEAGRGRPPGRCARRRRIGRRPRCCRCAGRRHRHCGCCDLGSGHGGPRPGLGRRVRAVTVDAAIALNRLEGVGFLSALRRGNVHGALDMGMAPGLLPGASAAERRLRRLRSGAHRGGHEHHRHAGGGCLW